MLEIRDAKKRARNGFDEKSDERDAAEEGGGSEQKRRYLVNSATKARERFNRQEGGGQMQAPSGFGGRPNMNEDDEEDYSSSSNDRVSSGRGCKNKYTFIFVLFVFENLSWVPVLVMENLYQKSIVK